MNFLELASGQSIQLPTVDRDDLVEDAVGFKGEVELSDVLVRDLQQRGVVGECSLTTAVVERANLADARLSPLRAADVLFTDVDFSNAALQQVDMRRVQLSQCRVIGVRWDIEHAADLFVDGCSWDFADVHLARVKGIAAFRNCSFRETRFSGDLSRVVFEDCDFVATEFDVSGAAGCDLRSSRLQGVRGLHNLKGALITSAQAASVAVELATEAGLSIRD